MDHSKAVLQLVEWLDRLAEVTDEPGGITRTFLSPAMAEANELVAGWMADAGMSTSVDSAGNLIGRLEGTGDRVLLTGSHLDTVRNAGRFDGILGVLLPIAAVGLLRESGWMQDFSLVTYGFSDEEGVRFQAGCLGSKALLGRLTGADLELRDAAGMSLREAMAVFREGGAPEPAWPEGRLIGYVETHIEQGPALELADCPVGVVTGINAQNRVRIRITGRAGHAGTTPMAARLDAGSGAAEFALAAERMARETDGLVATIGTMRLLPGAGNVIPGEAEFSLDVRHPQDAALGAACVALRERLAEICAERGLGFDWDVVDELGAVEFSDELTGTLERAVEGMGYPVIRLGSGAGHDAMVLADRCATSMLFVRCRDGLSHHPEEFVAPADLEVALRVFCEFLRTV